MVALDDLELKKKEEDTFPTSTDVNKTNEVVYQVLTTLSKQGKSYMDLTGKYPVKSAQGNQYILIAYNHDANAILAEPIKNRKAETIITAFRTLHSIFSQAGVAPHTWILDNERSSELEEAFTELEVKWQFVPPHTH